MDRDKIRDFYSKGMEGNRLEKEMFMLEGIRTKEIIERYLQGAGLRILDVGGGAGYYSFWLQEKGHQVTLVDLTPDNIELARKYGEEAGMALSGMETGDAVDLRFADEEFDLVLLMGPLYHLTDRKERIRALSEARRVLKPGGTLLAAMISRYASLFDGFQRDLVLDDQFFQLLKEDLNTGIHKNETENLEYFTTAFFHRPREIIAEIRESGLEFEKLAAVESFGWFIRNFSEKLKDPAYMEKLLSVISMVESNDDLMAMSPHIMAAARKG